MSNSTNVSLLLTLFCISYYLGVYFWLPNGNIIDVSQLEILREVEGTDELGQRYIYHRLSPIVFITGTTPLEEQNIIADAIESHPDIKECKNQSYVLSTFLKHELKRIQNVPQEYNALVENGVIRGYRSAISAFILEVLSKQETKSKRRSNVLCSRESEFLQYGTEIKRIFPNVKFIRTWGTPVRDVQKAMPEIFKKEALMSLWNDNQINSEMECKALGPKSCLQVTMGDWKNGTIERQLVYDFLFA